MLYFNLHLFMLIPALILTVTGLPVRTVVSIQCIYDIIVSLQSFSQKLSQRNKEIVQHIRCYVGCLMGGAHPMAGDRSKQAYKE